jgi:hypothetical protein
MTSEDWEPQCVCATVNCKVCRSAIALYCFNLELCEQGVNKSNHPIQNRSISHPYTSQYEEYYIKLSLDISNVMLWTRNFRRALGPYSVLDLDATLVVSELV